MEEAIPKFQCEVVYTLTDDNEIVEYPRHRQATPVNLTSMPF
jgi:hypothetical protein